jgi:hypothetical protein
VTFSKAAAVAAESSGSGRYIPAMLRFAFAQIAFALRTTSGLVRPLLPPPEHATVADVTSRSPANSLTVRATTVANVAEGSVAGRGPPTLSDMAERVASALWWTTPELVVALDAHLGLPVDSYLNGSQTWLAENGDLTLEWRLHPVGGFTQPRGLSHYDLWEQVVTQLSTGTPPDTLSLGDDTVALAGLWGGLECYVAFGDDLEPANLALQSTAALELAPDLCGLVDHQVVGDRWEQADRAVSIVQLLAEQLSA